ncbi:FISUMP domain-containing protein [Fibrobacter sp. UBA3718]|uniref:FISUMP domain-containing protein n=1 Tax=Fibrobacter sp. UBA3718 TaxID=1946531 RepID=UPI0025BFB064|nr:FISUMP domain-containing protein [Fibrobacter sp. UBA3718]
MKCVKGLGFLWVAVLAAFFALSACDDSSSASSDETSVSSSSVESPDSSVTLSPSTSSGQAPESAESNGSSNENMEKDKSSSSVKGSEPVEVSSSSAKETKDSSDSKSSSSVKSGESSSSSKDKSSSSVNSSSSNKQSSSSVKSSSSSVKQSSSSVASSSSEYIPYNHAGPLLADSLNSNAYQKFSDKRNGRSYYYLTINGKDGASVTVMAENLNIGEMVNGDKDQTNDSKIERYCYDNDTTKCDKYGGLYQWAEMMNLPFECNSKSCADSIKPNHQGICPDGWRLLTYDDLVVILNADGNEDGIKGARAQGFGGYNTTGYSLLGAGYRKNDGSFKDIDDGTYWMYPLEHETNVTRVRSSYTSIHQTAFAGLGVNDKSYGVSVRCVKSK